MGFKEARLFKPELPQPGGEQPRTPGPGRQPVKGTLTGKRGCALRTIA